MFIAGSRSVVSGPKKSQDYRTISQQRIVAVGGLWPKDAGSGKHATDVPAALLRQLVTRLPHASALSASMMPSSSG